MSITAKAVKTRRGSPVTSPDQPSHIRLLAAIMATPGWTQRRIAAELSCSVRTVRRWQRGQTEPHPGLIALLRVRFAEDFADIRAGK